MAKIFLITSLLMAIMFSSMITSSHAIKQFAKKQTLKPKFFGHNFPKPGFPQFPRPSFPTNPMPFPQFPKPGFPSNPTPGFPQLPGQGFPNNPMPFPQFPKPGFPSNPTPGFPQFPGFGFPKFPQFPKPGSPSFLPARPGTLNPVPTISTPPSLPVTPTVSP
ncbi:protein PELPK2-like [Raphanus sativus]|uniref:Protein PELPK2-like n=1 Tax=Raphanus sativus TaxID=3726 RepID=A0A6J0M785_RAPSA|nr:protein PELPK2-like [Raphanus sativus]